MRSKSSTCKGCGRAPVGRGALACRTEKPLGAWCLEGKGTDHLSGSLVFHGIVLGFCEWGGWLLFAFQDTAHCQELFNLL